MNNFLTWVEVDKKALLENITSFRKLIGLKTRLLSVVKGNAYGHGIEEVSSTIKDKVDWFGVNSFDEALVLKRLGITKPILILGYTPNSQLLAVVKNGFRQVVYDRKTATQLLKLVIFRPKIHLKIETGTHRQGVENRELLEIAQTLQKGLVNIEGVYTQKIEIEGASMHFATLEEEENAFYKKQLQRFQNQLKLLKKQGIDPPLRHTASTAAAILYPETYFDMVRVGIGLYGLWPSALVKQFAQKKGIRLELKPVLSWKTKVAQVKVVKKRETIGYGRTHQAKKEMRIAILPVGYFDGYDRGLGNNSRVLVRGKFAPVVGRVMMNMIIVDVTGVSQVRVEDEVVLVGKQGKNEITAEEMAKNIDTINYEVVSRINPKIRRILTGKTLKV